MTKIGYTSWDNNFACNLIELGVLGFLAEMLLFFIILKKLVANWFKNDSEDRVLQGGIIVSCMVFLFAMTNVFIFAPQLKYLFWALVAAGSNFSRVLNVGNIEVNPLTSEPSSEPAAASDAFADTDAITNNLRTPIY
jgi:O-antigen ligase